MEYIEEKLEGNVEATAIAICTLKRKGVDKEVIRTFSIEDAKRAGLWHRDTYKKYPARMLQMRARGFALRDAFADILRGLNIREEIEDISVEKEITQIHKNNSLIEELKQQLNEDKPIAEISHKINSIETSEELNQLTKEIKNGDYSEEEKIEIRKVFKEKKEELAKSKPETVAESSIRSIKSYLPENN